MVLRITEEIEATIVELGVDGRLVRLQLEEVVGGVEDDRRLIVRDYFHEEIDWELDEALAGLSALDRRAARSQGGRRDAAPARRGGRPRRSTPRGYRMLARIPRLPDGVIDAIVDRFGDLSKIMRATIEDLDEVEGVGRAEPGPSRRASPAWPRPASSSTTPELPPAGHVTSGRSAVYHRAMSTYLVTGACGSIGSNCVQFVADTQPDATVIAVDNLGFAANEPNLDDVRTEAGGRSSW